jgi:hypothetical protein
MCICQAVNGTDWSIDGGILTHIKEGIKMIACDIIYIDFETKTLTKIRWSEHF